MIHKDKKSLKGTKILNYINEGERKGFHLRPSCSSRLNWYDLGIREPNGFLHPMIHNDRQMVSLNLGDIYVDHNLFEIQVKQFKYLIPTYLFFICSIAPIIKELGGRVNLGEGALKTEGIDIEKFLTFNPSIINKQQTAALRKWLNKNKDFHHGSLFDELNAKHIDEVSLDKVKPDRRELDNIIMGDILGLTNEEQLEVYKAIIDLVRSRLEKAKSLDSKKHTQDGLNIDLFIKTVMDEVGEENLSNFYQTRIKNHNPLTTIKLPDGSGAVILKQDFFGWRLARDKQYLDCDSELKARYLKVWMEAGLESIEMPDDDYLKKIVPDLELLAQSINKIFESHLNSIVAAKLKEHLNHLLWREVTKEVSNAAG